MKNIYQRHDIMFSEKEVNKIREMVALIAGAGGLGTHQVMELYRLGVKKIYLVDKDKIETSNLNRQILYGVGDIGENKVNVAKKVLDSFKLDTEVVAITTKIDRGFSLPEDVDIVFDALDNFATRLILEQETLGKGVPLIHGGVQSWYGQVMTITPESCVKLKDVFSEHNDSDRVIPALSPVVSLVASFQVIEGIKAFLDYDNLLIDRLLVIDSKSNEINVVEL